MTWLNLGLEARRVRRAGAIISATLVAASLSFAPVAHAQVGSETSNSGAKGTVGGALLGAELVLVIEAAFDVEPWWAYALGGGLGAVGGALGGFAVDQQGEPLPSMSLLVAGLVLAVPTTIAVLNATAYEPETNPEIDEAALEAVVPRGPVLAVAPVAPSIVSFKEESFGFQMPAVEVTPVSAARLSWDAPGILPPASGAASSETTARVMVPVLGMSF